MKKHIFLMIALLSLRHPVLAQSSTVSGDRELLQGVWRQDCTNRASRAENFQADKVVLTESFFNDDKCASDFLHFINEGTFMLPASGQMDFQFTSVRLKITDESLVKNLNSRSVCGFQDWKLNEEKEISGRLCEIFIIGSPQKIPTVGDMRYGIYRLDNDRLYFGKLTRDENAMTPEKRPTNYDPRFYTRVPQALNLSLLGL